MKSLVNVEFPHTATRHQASISLLSHQSQGCVPGLLVVGRGRGLDKQIISIPSAHEGLSWTMKTAHFLIDVWSESSRLIQFVFVLAPLHAQAPLGFASWHSVLMSDIL